MSSLSSHLLSILVAIPIGMLVIDLNFDGFLLASQLPEQRTHWCKGAYTYYHYNQQSFDPEIIGMLLASMFGILVYQAFIEKRQVARWMLGLFVCGGAAFLGFVVPAELRCKEKEGALNILSADSPFSTCNASVLKDLWTIGYGHMGLLGVSLFCLIVNVCAEHGNSPSNKSKRG